MKRRDFICSAMGLLVTGRQARAAERPCPPALVNVSGGSSVASSCASAGAAGGTPKYMQGLGDFQVRNLEGEYAPRNSLVSVWDVLPEEWRALGQPNGADGVFTSWSGGAGDSAGRRLIVHGGGHNDSSNNGVYLFDFSGEDAPEGWQVAPNSLSSRAAVVSSSTVYSDNRPTSIHSYDQLWFDSNRNRLYRFSGSPYSAGAGASVAYFYDFDAGAWNSQADGKAFLHDPAIASLGSTLIGSPDGSTLLFLAATKQPRFVDVVTGNVHPFGAALSGSEENQFAAAIDTTRSSDGRGKCRYVALYKNGASGPRIKVFSVDWSARTWNVTTEQLLGAEAENLNSQGACIFYDGLRDSFWAFGNRAATSTGLVSSVYEIDAESFEVRRWNLDTSRASVRAKPGCKGGFNRHVWFPEWRVVGTVHAHDAPVSLIKLPAA